MNDRDNGGGGGDNGRGRCELGVDGGSGDDGLKAMVKDDGEDKAARRGGHRSAAALTRALSEESSRLAESCRRTDKA